MRLLEELVKGPDESARRSAKTELREYHTHDRFILCTAKSRFGQAFIEIVEKI